MKHKRQLLWLAMLACVFSSCSQSLSRKEAAETIIEHYCFPNVEIERIIGAQYARDHLTKNWNRAYHLFGGIQIGQPSPLFYFTQGSMYRESHYGLTELGYSYEAPKEACDACIEPLPSNMWGNLTYSCVACNVWEFKEVSGIVQAENGIDATVQYVIVARQVNVFGEYNNISEGMEVTKSATFKRYDDGSWRIEDPKPPYIVQPSDIPYYAKHYTQVPDK